MNDVPGPEEAVRLTLAELGEVPAPDLCTFIERRYGVRIDPRFLPVYRACIRVREQEERARARARSAALSQLPDSPPLAACGSPGLVSPVTPSPTGGLRAALLATGPQRLARVRQVALGLLAAHGLHGWSFAYNRQKRTLGLCVYHRHAIEVSVHLVQRNGPEEVLDTLLHEIAHALVGPGHGHDTVWRRKCLEVGARPLRCGQADMPLGRWRARCGACGAGFHRYRRPKRLKGWFCRRCGPERGGLVWQES